MAKCACGQELEEGFMGCLWCPDCEDDWKIPEDGKENPEYYVKLTLMTNAEYGKIKKDFVRR